ncbi:MAG: hypothetical protein AVDCRST_MAG76-51, partial [uncultured Acidimicrobiales bacterium]
REHGQPAPAPRHGRAARGPAPGRAVRPVAGGRPAVVRVRHRRLFRSHRVVTQGAAARGRRTAPPLARPGRGAGPHLRGRV